MSDARSRKAAVKKIKNLVLSPKQELEDFREKLEDSFVSSFLPNRVECSDKVYGGVKCDFIVPQVYSSGKIIIYIHGGSFTGGSRDSYRSFCCSLANASNCRVVVPEFRLAPTFPYPASIDDVSQVCNMVIAEEEVLQQLESRNMSGDSNGAQVILAADGSSASILLGYLLRSTPENRAKISNVVLFSPWLDLSESTPLIANPKRKDDILSGQHMHRAVDMYTFAANWESPFVSPLLASKESFEKFPPVMIQVGEKEILLDQCRSFEKLLTSAGIDCTLDVWKDMFFMFQMADEYLVESCHAIEKAGNYINRKEEMSIKESLEREKVLKMNHIR